MHRFIWQNGVEILVVFVFFFNQKTAYEIKYGLVGSEMYIRDRVWRAREYNLTSAPAMRRPDGLCRRATRRGGPCPFYTSDAADERSRVDLGGSRILKKKKKK